MPKKKKNQRYCQSPRLLLVQAHFVMRLSRRLGTFLSLVKGFSKVAILRLFLLLDTGDTIGKFFSFTFIYYNPW